MKTKVMGRVGMVMGAFGLGYASRSLQKPTEPNTQRLWGWMETIEAHPERFWHRLWAESINNATVADKRLQGYDKLDSMAKNMRLATDILPDNCVISVNYSLILRALADRTPSNEEADALMKQADKIAEKCKPEAEQVTHGVSKHIAEGYGKQQQAQRSDHPGDKQSFLAGAIADYQQAHKLSPRKITACLLGEAYRDIAKLEPPGHRQHELGRKAVDWFQQAVTLNDGYGLAHLRLAQQLNTYGDKELAKYHFEQAFKLWQAAPRLFPKELQEKGEPQQNTGFFGEIPNEMRHKLSFHNSIISWERNQPDTKEYVLGFGGSAELPQKARAAVTRGGR